MRPVGEMTDSCLLLMKPNELWGWDKWWIDVCKNGEVPRRKTYAYQKWIEKRSKEMGRINLELLRRNRPERLFCPGAGQGIYLVNEDEVAEKILDYRIRRVVNTVEKSHNQMRALSRCPKLKPEDARMLSRMSDMLELQSNTLIGSIAKMRSLPPATKKRLLKKLGIDTK